VFDRPEHRVPGEVRGHRKPQVAGGRVALAEPTAAFLLRVLEDVGHSQWVFTIPKMLHPLFFRSRELRGGLARLAWQTVRELMAAAVEEPQLRPGMVRLQRSPSAWRVRWIGQPEREPFMRTPKPIAI
jgi:hypothetical protein